MTTPTTSSAPTAPTVAKSDTSLEVRRVFNASRQRLFDAWTNPELVAKWFHPAKPMTTTVSELTVQVGGRYRFVMHGDGDHIIGGVYQEIVPAEKLVFTWQWESEEETTEMLITLTFIEIEPERTELVLLHERFYDTEQRDSHEIGWNGTLTELERLLSL